VDTYTNLLVDGLANAREVVEILLVGLVDELLTIEKLHIGPTTTIYR